MPATHSTPTKSSPARIAVIVALLLLAFWLGRKSVCHDESPVTNAAKPETGAAAKSVDTSAAGYPSLVSKQDETKKRSPGQSDQSTKASEESMSEPETVAEPAIALAPDGTPLWKQKRPDVVGDLVPETEYQRQTRIWRDGAHEGRLRKFSGHGLPVAKYLGATAESIFPDDQTGQILWQLGYEWGYLSPLGY